MLNRKRIICCNAEGIAELLMLEAIAGVSLVVLEDDISQERVGRRDELDYECSAGASPNCC